MLLSGLIGSGLYSARCAEDREDLGFIVISVGPYCDCGGRNLQ
jgi:hypothetical protein